MSGPGDTPEKPAAGGDAPEKNVTVTPARIAHARTEPGAIPASPGDSGEPMDLKGTEAPATAQSENAAKSSSDGASKEATEKALKELKEETPTGSKAPKDKAPKRRGVVAWFFAGLGFAIAVLAGLASWNVWAEPHYVISPRLDAVMQDFGGYVATVTLFGLALIAATLLRGRAAFVVTAGIVILGVLVAVLTTVLLGMGAAIMCNREPVFAQGSPDRRLEVIAVRGKCGVTREYTYRVSVRELGPSIPRETMIFQSFGRPAPAEVVFSQDRTISVLIKSTNAEAAPRYTVTIDRKTFKPDKVWRFDMRTD
jgi:hypothetical protein